jgi:hypothetical protein
MLTFLRLSWQDTETVFRIHRMEADIMSLVSFNEGQITGGVELEIENGRIWYQF